VLEEQRIPVSEFLLEAMNAVRAGFVSAWRFEVIVGHVQIWYALSL
jgi:hypothetical protein